MKSKFFCTRGESGQLATEEICSTGFIFIIIGEVSEFLVWFLPESRVRDFSKALESRNRVVFEFVRASFETGGVDPEKPVTPVPTSPPHSLEISSWGQENDLSRFILRARFAALLLLCWDHQRSRGFESRRNPRPRSISRRTLADLH